MIAEVSICRVIESHQEQLLTVQDGEKGVLCSLLLSPQQVADLCLLQLRTEAFFIPAHRIIYDLVLEFHEKGKPVEFVALKQALSDRVRLDEIGGAEFLSHLYSF